MNIGVRTLIDITLLLIIYIFHYVPKWRKLGSKTFIIKSNFYFYLMLVLLLTLSPFVASIPNIFKTNIGAMNLIPFIDLRLNRINSLTQVILNIVLMVPFGFLLPQVRKFNGFSVVLTTFLLSTTIELSQLIMSSRISDVTDIITNTIGGILGYMIYTAYLKIKNKPKNENN